MTLDRLKIFITVDVEPRINQAINSNGKEKPVGIPALYGIDFITRIMQTYNAKALYYFEALHHYYFQDEIINYFKQYIDPELTKVGLHIHPAWLTFRDNTEWHDHCSDYSTQQLIDMIDGGLSFLARHGFNDIKDFRAGNLSASENLFNALSQKNFHYGSTSARAYAKSSPYFLRTHLRDNVFETPVTTFNRFGLKEQLFSITGVSFAETKYILNQAYYNKCQSIVIITHPFEFITEAKKDLRINQKRLQNLCAFVKQNQNKFEFSNDFSLLQPNQDMILSSNPWYYTQSLVEGRLQSFFSD